MIDDPRSRVASARPGPVFIGGTGRSGTTVMGELVGARADLSFVPIELRLHVDPGGLTDLASGRVTFPEFSVRMRRQWFERPPNHLGERGLQVVANRPVMRKALYTLRDTVDDDPWAACGQFLTDVLTPMVVREGTDSFVEMTPPNAHAMDGLCQMFPDARIVHMVRDGRDVAASVARHRWGPNDIESALVWWGDHMAQIAQSRQRADPSRVLEIRLEAFVGPGRDEQYDRLVEFVGRGEDAGMRAYFEEHLSADEAHGGAWRRGLDPDQERRLQQLYDEQLTRLDELGIQLPPAD